MLGLGDPPGDSKELLSILMAPGEHAEERKEVCLSNLCSSE